MLLYSNLETKYLCPNVTIASKSLCWCIPWYPLPICKISIQMVNGFLWVYYVNIMFEWHTILTVLFYFSLRQTILERVTFENKKIKKMSHTSCIEIFQKFCIECFSLFNRRKIARYSVNRKTFSFPKKKNIWQRFLNRNSSDILFWNSLKSTNFDNISNQNYYYLFRIMTTRHA